MSERVNHEDVKTVSADGVTVERELVCTDAGIEGTFVVQSRREDPVRVRLEDEFPEYFPIDEVAFRPDGAPDAGTITPGRVTLTQVAGDESIRVRYGIVPSEPVAEVRWSAPEIAAVEPVESADGDRPEADGSVGPVAHLPGLFDTDPTGTDDDSADATDAADDPSATGADTQTAGDEATEADRSDDPADATTRIEPQSESSADASSGDAANGKGADGAHSDDDRTGDETGEAATASESEPTEEAVARRFEVRLDRLSARVEKFGAYASALEPFIDERGTGERALAGIEDDLSDLDRRLTAVREDVETAREDRERAVTNLQDSVGDVDGALDDVEAAVETLETEIEGIDLGLEETEADLHALEDRVADHDDAIDSTERDVADLEADLGDVGGDVERVERELDDVGTDVTSVEGDVTTLGEDLNRLETRLDDVEDDFADLSETVESIDDELATLSTSVESIHEELEGIHGEVETLHTFRKSLAQISNMDE